MIVTRYIYIDAVYRVKQKLNLKICDYCQSGGSKQQLGFLQLKGQYNLVTSYFEIVHIYQILISAPIIIAAKFFVVEKNQDVSKMHIRRHFPSIDMGWRPLAHVCLWFHLSSCLHSTRRRYIVSINTASIKAYSIAYPFQVFGSFYFSIDGIKCNRNFHGYYHLFKLFLLKSTCYKVILSL